MKISLRSTFCALGAVFVSVGAYAQLIGTSPVTGLKWGNSYLTSEQGGGIRLQGSSASSTPYLDFCSSTTAMGAYDVRLIFVPGAFFFNSNTALQFNGAKSIGFSPTENLLLDGKQIIFYGQPTFTKGIASGACVNCTDSKGAALAVNGQVLATEVVVKNKADIGWPDYVFAPSYKLRTLGEVESFVKANSHLPEVPSAAQVSAQGINLSEMNAALLKKVEELTLYLIEQDKQLKAQAARIEKLEQGQ